MSREIDSRVVEMQFDNSKFESNVRTTMSTLEKLKESLNLKGASKGLENVEALSKNINMSTLGNAVESVRIKFSALEVMAVTALANITNSAVNAGKRIVSALTIDPIKTGFAEYETQINAVQTILANTSSKGTTLDQVNEALDELNLYADKTIYNFTEMTRNIGTFTAAGVDLDTSVSAIKGIANLAAVSGSTSQQASTAMYQLSQALAAGTVKLMDWNSVVNAGMGGQVFQDALKETARVHGIAIDQMITEEGSFRETLQAGWLSSEILTETLAKFTGDLNEEQLRTMGYTEDQIKSIIKMGQTANDAATKVKTFTQLWDTLKEAAQSGWTQSWEIIIGDFEEAKASLTEVSDAFGALIGASADARNELLQGWKDLGGRTALIEAFKNAFEGINSIVKPIGEAFREIFPPLTAKHLFNFTEGLKELTSHLKLSETTSNNLKATFKGLFAILNIARQAFLAVFNAIVPLFGGLDNVGGGVLGITAAFGNWIVKINETLKSTDILNKTFQGISNTIQAVSNGIKNLIQGIQQNFSFPGFELFHSFIENIGGNINNAIKNADFSGFLNLMGGLSIGGVALGINKFLKSLSSPLESFSGMFEGVTGILDDARESFKAYQNQLKAGTLMKIAIAIGILAASLFLISTIDGPKLAAALGGMSVLFAELMASMSLFGKFNFKFVGVHKTIAMMIGLSTAIFILAGSLKMIASLNFKQLAVGITGIAGLATVMVLAAKALSTGNAAILKGATQMIIFAAAIKILASAVEDLSKLKWDELGKGLLAVGVLLGEIVLFTNFASSPKGLISTGIAMVAIAAAMKTLASAVGEFGSMNVEQLAKGLTAMAVSLTAVTVAINFMPKNMISSGVGLIAISTALVVLAGALEKMGNMEWENIARGLIALGGSMVILTIALMAMSKTLPGSAALLVAASALAILAPALLVLGGMGWENIAKGLIAIAGAFTVLGAGSVILAPLLPVILGLSAAIALFGVGCLAAGAGISLLSAGLIALSVSVTAVSASLMAIMQGLASLIPAILTNLADGIVEFARVIGNGAPVLAESFLKIISGILDTIIKYIPKIVESGVQIILGLLKGISDNIKKVLELAVEIMVNFIEGVKSMLPKIIQAGYDLIIAFINGLADCIEKNTPVLVASMERLISVTVKAALKVLSGFVSSFSGAGKEIINGLINGIKSRISSVASIGSSIGRSLLNAAKKVLGIRSPSKVFEGYGVNIAEGLTKGIKKETPKAVKESSTMAKKVIKASKDELDKSVKWIDERKYYNQLSLKEELAAWERVQKRYKEGTEERKKADREVYRVKKELTKADLENSINWIDERKYYNEMSLEEELAAWERVQSRYEAGTEERKRADREVYRLKKELNDKQKQREDEYYEKTKEINEKLIQDIKAVNDEYESALESRTQSLYKAYGLFDKVEEPEKVTGDELLNNLQSQVDAFESWEKNLKKLAKKGISEGLLSELQEMGPSALGKIKALNRLSKSELNKYEDLWEDKHKLARKKAIKELEGLRIESDRKIELLNAQAEKQLNELSNIYQMQLSGITETTQNQLSDFNSKWDTKVEELKVENKKDFTEIATDVQTAFKNPDWVSIGQNIIDGITKGVNDKAAKLANAAASAAKNALKAANQALGIKSPSKEFAKVGMYSMEGFVEGVNNYAASVKSSVKDVGKMTMATLNTSIADISDFINSGMDVTPTIRPVIDFTDVMNGTGAINSLFNKHHGFKIEVLTSKAESINYAMKNNDNTSLSGMVNDLKDTIKNSMAQKEFDLSGTLRVNVINDRGEIIGIAETAIKDLLRRESR